MTNAEHNLVLILARQLAANAAIPMLLVDEMGFVVYCNELGLALLGSSIVRREASVPGRWDLVWELKDAAGEPLSEQPSPTAVAVATREPVQAVVRVDGARSVAVSAFPLFSRPEQLVGAFAIVWPDTTGTT